MSVNSGGEANWSCGCVAAGSAASRTDVAESTTQKNESVHGKNDLPRELNFNLGPCVTCEVSPDAQTIATP